MRLLKRRSGAILSLLPVLVAASACRGPSTISPEDRRRALDGPYTFPTPVLISGEVIEALYYIYEDQGELRLEIGAVRVAIPGAKVPGRRVPRSPVPERLKGSLPLVRLEAQGPSVTAVAGLFLRHENNRSRGDFLEVPIEIRGQDITVGGVGGFSLIDGAPRCVVIDGEGRATERPGPIDRSRAD